MKNKLKIIFLLFIVLLCIPKVNAATNPYSKTSSYGVNCVWYVWNQVYNKKGIALPGWGNAKSWYSDAKKMSTKYLARYKKHFKNPIIITYDLQHEELLAIYKDKWIEEIKRVYEEKCNLKWRML